MNPSLVDVAFHGLRIIIIIRTYNTCVSLCFFFLSLLSRSFKYPFFFFFSHFTSFFSYLPYMIRFSKFHFCPHSNKAPIRSQFLLFLCVAVYSAFFCYLLAHLHFAHNWEIQAKITIAKWFTVSRAHILATNGNRNCKWTFAWVKWIQTICYAMQNDTEYGKKKKKIKDRRLSLETGIANESN